ncbi:MAG: hypothetical protein KJ900_10670 [Proteobacteria bacterium]|jgi:hypothetical protein|nr:hypothetical protein [Pseudomonadota bacterium]MCG2744457.1 hypothetical protein [Desulfobacteraceae bacterium]MBU3982157.1 hypothetical protein [Pseudomonadota bacterium]MBU4029973.1 hypothetical protein [Pseudomonadota bacterium]MBU4043341.1 hypothetical protein [Pseudomonadota bacterium]
MEKNYIATLLFITTLALTLLTFGCDSQGPAEKSGEKIDQAIESTKDAAGDAADKITGKGPAEKVGESIDETAEKMKE